MRINKWLLVGIGVIVILVIIAVFFVFKDKTPQNSAQTTWVSKQTREYTVLYPPDWKISEGTLLNNQLSFITIKPPTFKEDKAAIIIQAADISVTSVAQKQAAFKDLGYHVSLITVDGINATKLVGTTPAVNNSLPKQEIAIFFQKGNIVYTVELIYLANQTNPEYEQVFNEVSQSFHPTPQQ